MKQMIIAGNVPTEILKKILSYEDEEKKRRDGVYNSLSVEDRHEYTKKQMQELRQRTQQLKADFERVYRNSIGKKSSNGICGYMYTVFNKIATDTFRHRLKIISKSNDDNSDNDSYHSRLNILKNF